MGLITLTRILLSRFIAADGIVRLPAGTVVVTTSVNRLAAAPPHSAGHVEASNPDIIMRRLATSEWTMTPAMASPRWRRHRAFAHRDRTVCANPDQLRRGERYRLIKDRAQWRLDNRPQLKEPIDSRNENQPRAILAKSLSGLVPARSTAPQYRCVVRLVGPAGYPVGRL